MENDKKKSVLLIAVGALVVIVLFLGGFIFYNKVLKPDNERRILNVENTKDPKAEENELEENNELEVPSTSEVTIDVDKASSEVVSFLKKTLQDELTNSHGTGATPQIENLVITSLDCTGSSCVANYKLYLSLYDTEICSTYKNYSFTNITTCNNKYLIGTHKLNIKLANGSYVITNKEKTTITQPKVDEDELRKQLKSYLTNYLTEKLKERHGTGATPVIKKLELYQMSCKDLTDCRVVYNLVLEPYEQEMCGTIYEKYNFTDIYECTSDYLEGVHVFNVKIENGKYTITSKSSKTSSSTSSESEINN